MVTMPGGQFGVIDARIEYEEDTGFYIGGCICLAATMAELWQLHRFRYEQTCRWVADRRCDVESLRLRIGACGSDIRHEWHYDGGCGYAAAQGPSWIHKVEAIFPFLFQDCLGYVCGVVIGPQEHLLTMLNFDFLKGPTSVWEGLEWSYDSPRHFANILMFREIFMCSHILLIAYCVAYCIALRNGY